ncbi:hypothetical protein H6S82_06545 [Planktothrix sp. FACHB-1355]|uniref:Uncharacterized protein n=1 Tax=Aerosakkonema funiforme FACHB-1375 TaxID=2949571 RepID=A0A926ZH03_9CYAN|nr:MULTISPECIES: hypothetical protein [Oscillatoriales]MBD2182768.1 hypothetical protein [Aerosakkonema funiforme FACHB-1375]MBD3558514.1 hypothetical protein [Planktothrix sp. FACHB-1355]
MFDWKRYPSYAVYQAIAYHNYAIAYHPCCILSIRSPYFSQILWRSLLASEKIRLRQTIKLTALSP